jgi:DNA-binding LytR/AlgR family response regulator
MHKRLNHLINLIKEDLGLYLSFSLGVFLFILFFQPFPIDSFDFNNSLLFFAGLGAIVFLSIIIIRILIPWIVQNNFQNDHEYLLLSYMGGFFILALSTIASVFYLRYVGLVEISFYVIFKVALICLAPPVGLRLYDRVREMKQEIDDLITEIKVLKDSMKKYEDEAMNSSISFLSENKSDNITLAAEDIVFIRSADNYVEIVYKEGASFKKSMLRNTLKNVEYQLRQFPAFVRCHRICIVNIHQVENLSKSYNNYLLTIRGYDEKIPVSRQYLLKIRELLKVDRDE